MRKASAGVVIVAVAVLVAVVSAWGRDYELVPSLSWDGKDASGAVEASLPVTFELRDADSGGVVSSAQVAGPVTGYVMPSVRVAVPDNTSTTRRYYATAKDAAGNVSAPSNTVEVTLAGDDTIGPMAPVIVLEVQQ